MAHSIRAAQAVLRSWRAGANSQSAIYRTATTVRSIRVTVGQTSIQTDDGQSISRAKHTDFLVEITQLPSLPLAGDRIVLNGKHYAVAALVPGGPVYEWHGTDQLTYRIHATQIETVPIP